MKDNNAVKVIPTKRKKDNIMEPELKVYNGKSRPVLYLTLKKFGDHVELDLVTKNGEYIPNGCLLTIDKKGIRIESHVYYTIPLPLDKEGRVVVRKG